MLSPKQALSLSQESQIINKLKAKQGLNWTNQRICVNSTFFSYTHQTYQTCLFISYGRKLTGEQQKSLPLLLLILPFQSALKSISVNGQTASAVVLAVLFTPLFLDNLFLLCFKLCQVKACFHPCHSSQQDHAVPFTELSWGGFGALSTGVTWPALVLSPSVTSAKWDPSPVHALIDSAGSRSAPNTLVFIGQNESQELCKGLNTQNYHFVLDNSGQPASGSKYWISIILGSVWISGFWCICPLLNGSNKKETMWKVLWKVQFLTKTVLNTVGFML